MELLDGESLDGKLAREGVSWRRALEIAAAIADGLSADGRTIKISRYLCTTARA
jgi:hypothetical protein